MRGTHTNGGHRYLHTNPIILSSNKTYLSCLEVALNRARRQEVRKKIRNLEELDDEKHNEGVLGTCQIFSVIPNMHLTCPINTMH